MIKTILQKTSICVAYIMRSIKNFNFFHPFHIAMKDKIGRKLKGEKIKNLFHCVLYQKHMKLSVYLVFVFLILLALKFPHKKYRKMGYLNVAECFETCSFTLKNKIGPLPSNEKFVFDFLFSRTNLT